MLLQTCLSVTIIFIAFVKIEAETPCKEKPVCDVLWIPRKFCGKWMCYGVYNPVKPELRNYQGMTTLCAWMLKGSFAISIHCQEENDWARKVFGPYFTGLHIPPNLPWNESNFRWTDGSPLDFTDWAKPGQGGAFQQPHNDIPGQNERIVVHTNHWHDVVADASVIAVPCKKAPLRVERTNCPTTTTPTPPTTTTMTTTTTTTPAPAPLAMETVQEIHPATVKPSPENANPTKPPTHSCRVK